MDKRAKNILILLGLGMLTIIITELTRPKPINWNPSYTSTDTVPFGGYILFEELKTLSENTVDVTQISKNPYEFLQNDTYQNNSSYIFINSSFNFDQRFYEKLMAYVRDGNSAFIAANSFGGVFSDSLNIKVYTEYQLTEEEIKPTFFSPGIFQDSTPSLKKGIYKTIFKSFDTTKTTVLGYYQNEERALDQVNFIKITEGAGAIYLNTLPEAYSNYYMLKGTKNYIANTLSFAEASHFYWDDYLKDGRKIIDSPMRFVLNQISLKWAYYLLLLGLLVFVIFRGKREQRIVPVVQSLENTSIEYTKTIGDLYFQHKDYSNIISKKITYFLEKIRSHYYLNTNELNTAFINKLATKTNHSAEETKKIIDYINTLKGRAIHNEADLIELNKRIEEFTL